MRHKTYAVLRFLLRAQGALAITGILLGSFCVGILSEVFAAADNSAAQNSGSPVAESSDMSQRRSEVVSPQEIQSTVNKRGPEYWPEDAAISTKLGDSSTQSESSTDKSSQTATQVSPTPPATQDSMVKPAPEQTPASTDDKAAQQATTEKRPVIYVDEEGNEVPKPPVPEELFDQAVQLIQDAKFSQALPILEQLRSMHDVPQQMREQVLYYRSDAIAALHEGKAQEGYEAIVSSTEEALNANLRSSRVPDALYRLGLANLNVGNITEAEAYFRALKRRFPYDNNVPTAFFQLGMAQLEKKLFAEAEENFRAILQEYPDSSAIKKSTMALVRALVGLEKYDDALVYADFAEKRWARQYIEDPKYLESLAMLDYSAGNKPLALQKFWLLYNLTPTAEDSSETLARIGDLYLELDQLEPAMEVFGEILHLFPDSAAAALAILRRSEKGMFDSPINGPEMFAVFENPGQPLPQVVYQQLQAKRPNDARSKTAKLKYALWQLWGKQYTDAMGTAADFIDLYPENVDVEVARDTIMRGFMADLKNSLLEENYGRVLILWNGFPLVRERYGEIDPALRNALGRGYIERGDDAKAMEMLKEFLKTPKHPTYSDSTYALYLNKYLDSKNWNAILDLGEIVKDWEMSKSMRGQLDYALALSSQNLGLQERALAMWKDLEQNQDIPKYQRAYATYFLAKDAENRRDIRDAYSYYLKTLKAFDELKQERSNMADELRRKEAMNALMDITEVANRIPEALEWVELYNQFVAKDSPEFPGLRFREARLYRKLGNNEKAKSLLEIITKDYPSSPFATAASTELATFNVSRDLQNFLPKN